MRFLRFVVSNIPTLLFAIALAVVIWAAAIRQADPVESRIIEIPVEIVGKPADAIIIGRTPDSVFITIEGAISALDQISPADFSAVIDLSDVPYGESEIDIIVSGGSDQIEIQNQFPESTTLRLDQIVTQEIPVSLQVRGEVARGHRIGEVVIEPDIIQVTGPAERVNQLSESRVTVFVDDDREDIIEQRQPTFFDVDGNVASVVGLTVVPSEVEVVLPVVQMAGFAEKPITVRWDGEPASGFRLMDVTVDPGSVQVTGLPALLEGLRVQTAAIDITGLNETQTLSTGLELPEGISMIDVQPVFVTVVIEPIFSSDIVQRPVEIRALEEGFEAIVDPEDVRVFLYGPLPILDTMTEEDVRVTVDLLGLITGTHVLEPFVSLAVEGIEVRSTQPPAVTVILSASITVTEELTDTVSQIDLETFNLTIDASDLGSSYWVILELQPSEGLIPRGPTIHRGSRT
jgi:YbbR domain-containing protein